MLGGRELFATDQEKPGTERRRTHFSRSRVPEQWWSSRASPDFRSAWTQFLR